MKTAYSGYLYSSVLAILVLAIAWLLYERSNGFKIVNDNIETIDWLESIKKETVNRTVQAKLLIQPHFPKHDLIILSSTPRPSGALEIIASIAKTERTFIVLADNKSFVEGVLNSPYLDSSTITSEHTMLTRERANTNSQNKAEYENLKTQFKKTSHQSGLLKLDDKSSHLSERQITEAFVMPEVTTNVTQATKRDLVEQTKQLEGVVFGNKNAPSVYVYFDFQCSACLVSHKILDRLTTQGLIKVHYIPVGIQGNEGTIKSAYTLISPDNEKRKIVFNHMKKQLPIEKLLTSKATEKQLKQGLVEVLKNKKVFISLPKPSTPTFLYEHDGIAYVSIVTTGADIKNIVSLLKN
jgi:hypothetical protein